MTISYKLSVMTTPSMSKHFYYFAIFVSIVFCLLGCSGSSLDSDTDTPTPNVLVNAGANQTVDEQTTVTLSAVATGQTEVLTYAWSAVPELSITQDDSSVGTATFVAPTTTEVLTYTFTLEVTDEDGNTGSDTVTIQVNPVNLAPVALIQLTQFLGLESNQFPAGYEVVLDGSSSTDTDSTDTDNPIEGYTWQQTAGESVIEGVSTQGDSLAFITPILNESNSLSFSLTVTDEEGAQDTATVNLTVQSSAQTLPSVEAGFDHVVFSGESIILSGSASTTVAASEPLVSNWLNDSEQDPLIADTTAVQTVAVAPAVSSQESVTFTLNVQDAQGNVVEDSLTVTIKPLPIQPLNDTGVIQQATATSVSSEYQPDYPGQDGQRGQDIIHDNDLSEKAGRGEQGFDFTRLDEVGDEVDDLESDWRCVRDNITGLIWEVKTDPSSTELHSSQHSYSWYQTDNNGGDEGDSSGEDTSCSITDCNTESYVAQVNTQGLCNFRDWRLPTHNELLSILHLGQTAAPMVDVDYFPYTTDSLDAPVWYWTQDSSADGFADEQAQNAWAIDFASGNDNFLNKSSAARVRLVRAGR